MQKSVGEFVRVERASEPAPTGSAWLRRVRALAAACVALALVFAAPAQESEEPRPDPQVIWVTVHGDIGVSTVAKVQSALREAHSSGVARVLLDINVPGGELEHTKEVEGLIQRLAGEEVRVVAFVRRDAYSVGAYVALSCQEIFMAPPASIGAVTPSEIGPSGFPQFWSAEEHEAAIADLRESMQALVARNASIPPQVAKAAEAMVDPAMRIFEVTYENAAGVQVTAVKDEAEMRELDASGVQILNSQEFPMRPLVLSASEAERLGFSSGTYASIEELIQDEFGVSMDAVVRRDNTWSEGAVAWIDGIKPLLFVFGFMLLMLELKTPGFAVPGVLGVALLAIAMFGSYLVGLAEWTEILLFFMGIGFVAVEIFLLPGTLIFGLGGFVCIVAGLILSQQSFFVPVTAAQHDILLTNLSHMLYLTVLVIVGAIIMWKITPYVPVLNRVLQAPPDVSYTGASTQFGKDAGQQTATTELIGRSGVATTDLRPVGMMDLDGQPVDVLAEGAFVSRGTQVRVIEVRANQVVVEPLAEGESSESGEASIPLLILLWVLGLCFVIAEIFFPSFGILSVLAALSFVAAIFFAYTDVSTAAGHAFLGAAAVAVPVVAYYALKFLPNTAIGRRLVLTGPERADVQNAAEEPGIHQYQGKSGVALSDLRPSGTARIGSDRVDVITRGEMVEKGAPVVVVQVDGNRVVVASNRSPAATETDGTPN